MRVEAAAYEGGNLILKTADAAARRFVFGFKAGEYELVKTKKRRSLDANAYCFCLIDKIAEAVCQPKSDIYRQAIKEIGGNNEIVCVQDKAVETLCRGWERNGLGWITETIPSKLPGCTNVVLYYGSSVYDRKTMSRLIDFVVQDAKALGIETLTPRELARLEEEWDAKAERLNG